MSRRSFAATVLALTLAFGVLTPVAAFADGGASGPFYVGIASGPEAYIRGGERLTEEDFDANFRFRPGDQLFFGETLYHSTARGARGTRAGRSVIVCMAGVGQRLHCDATLILRDQGALYLQTSTSGDDRFLAAIVGGTRDFKASRGDIVITGLSDTKTLYQLRLR
jgi:hypothetical protein